VVSETFAIERLALCLGNTSCEASAISLGHVGLELQEGLQALDLQMGSCCAAAANLAGIDRIGASAAGKIEVTEIQFCDRAAASAIE
jgi:hypothetical protein